MDIEELYRKILERRSREGSFKNYLENLVRQFEDLRGEHSKAKNTIREFKYDMEKKQSAEGQKDP